MMEWGWLSALEACGLAGDGGEWRTHAFSLEAEDGDVRALCPVYLRDDSVGEYFDFSPFELTALRLGIPRGPRAVVVVPWTPVPGSRVLTGTASPEVRQELLEATADGLLQLARDLDWASVHLLFCAPDEEAAFVRRGFFARRSCQFQWHNPSPELGADFSVYLDGLSGRRRRKVLAERRRFAQSGIELSYERGVAEDFLSFWEAYRATARRNDCAEPPLPKPFFEELATRFAHRVEFVVARREGKILGRTLNLRGDDQSWYGRYWGALDPPPLLHFEATLYAGIERCLELGLSHFDPGYGGDHKVLRGFVPQRVFSAHWYAHPMLHEGGKGFAQEEVAWLEEAYFDRE